MQINRISLGMTFVITFILLMLVLSPVSTGAKVEGVPNPAEVMAATGTAFTYQGRLTDGGSPANGTYNFRFYLWAEEGKTTLLGTYPTSSTVAIEVTDGYFTTTLDFGVGVFNGEARWLEIEVNGVALSPLQPLTPTPYAIYAQNAPWNGLSGVPAGFADGEDNDTTYTPGYGLDLNSTQFNVDISEVQSRVIGACPDGWAIRTIYADGTVYCGIVDDPTSFWSLSGNTGTSPGTDYLGTVDNVAMEIRVNNQRALRIEPNDTSPNLVGGYSGNSITPGVYGATISGGGSVLNPGYYNLVTDSHGTVSGGAGNRAGNGTGTVDDAFGATVGGGGYNFATAYYSTVSGGGTNQATSGNSTVSGGTNNLASGADSTVGGGLSNQAIGADSTVGGGKENIASGTQSTIAGGADNSAAYRATVGGGLSNTAESYGTVPGGYLNYATGYSFAAGRRAKAEHPGSFVFADTNDFDFDTLVEDSFKVRATGGVRFVVGIDGSGNTTWSCVLTYGNNWSCTSDRNMKENFKTVEGREILDRLSQIPIQRWNAIGGEPGVDHMGPMAQDFYAAFGLGEDERLIGTMDANGVALAAIQGLYEISQDQTDQIKYLQAENDSLRKQLGSTIYGNPSNTFSLLVYGLTGLVLLLLVGLIWLLLRLRNLGVLEVAHGR